MLRRDRRCVVQDGLTMLNQLVVRYVSLFDFTPRLPPFGRLLTLTTHILYSSFCLFCNATVSIPIFSPRT